jgi:hypothetical protein
MGHGERRARHTFVLAGKDGRVLWIKDYGAPDHGGLMYVKPSELAPLIADQLRGS